MLQYEVDFYNQFAKLSRKLTQDNEFIKIDKVSVRASAIESVEIIECTNQKGPRVYRISVQTATHQYGSQLFTQTEVEKEYQKILEALKKA